MTSKQIDPGDTGTWLPLDGLAAGFGAGKAPLTAALAGRELTVAGRDGSRTRCGFLDDNRLTWELAGRSGGPDGCEVFAVAPDLYYVEFMPGGLARTAVSLVVDMASGHGLAVLTRIGAAGGPGTACSQEFLAGPVEEIPARGEPPAPSTDLIGRRALWVYGDAHAYEHVYLSGHWYSWQCLAGPERGLADTDACTTYRVRPGIYVFAWREKVVPCAAVTVADHGGMRSHGALFGLDESGERTVHFTFGGHGRLLGATVYPERLSPPAG